MFAIVVAAVGIGFIHYLGLGTVAAAGRPTADRGALGLVIALMVALAFAGLLDPVLNIKPAEAQWLVTTPGGAAAILAQRARGLLLYGLQVASFTVGAQLISSGSLDLAVAGVLGLWAAGYALTSASARFAFAAYIESHRQPHVRRIAGVALVGACGWVLTRSEAVAAFLGAPAAGGSLALPSALAWCASGAVVAAMALMRAEALVVGSIAAGRPGGRAVRRSSRSARVRSAEPDDFRLSGAWVTWWVWLLGRRRRARSQSIFYLVLVIISSALAARAPGYLPALVLAMLTLLVLVQTSAPQPAPVGSNGLLLPSAHSARMARALPLAMLVSLELLAVPLVAWLMAGEQGTQFKLATALCIPALLTFLAALGLRVRDPARGADKEQSRRQRALAVTGLAVGAGLFLAGTPLVGALLAGLWWIAAAAGLVTYELRAVATLSGPRVDGVGTGGRRRALTAR